MLEKEVRSSRARVNAVRPSHCVHMSQVDEGVPIPHQNVVSDASCQLLSHKCRSTKAEDVSESLSDIDDAEVIRYLNSKKEMVYKRIIWELMNKDYRKGRLNKRAKKTKKSTPAKDASKDDVNMQNKKRLSSKINYDVLEKLFDESEESHKKADGENKSNLSNNGKKQQFKEKFSTEAQSLENEDDESEHGTEYSQDVNANEDYYGNNYSGLEDDEYNYIEDFDNEEY